MDDEVNDVSCTNKLFFISVKDELSQLMSPLSLGSATAMYRCVCRVYSGYELLCHEIFLSSVCFSFTRPKQ